MLWMKGKKKGDKWRVKRERGGMDEGWGGGRKQRRETDREWIEGVERRERGGSEFGSLIH